MAAITMIGNIPIIIPMMTVCISGSAQRLVPHCGLCQPLLFQR
jgi:hypothetical protein